MGLAGYAITGAIVAVAFALFRRKGAAGRTTSGGTSASTDSSTGWFPFDSSHRNTSDADASDSGDSGGDDGGGGDSGGD